MGRPAKTKAVVVPKEPEMPDVVSLLTPRQRRYVEARASGMPPRTAAQACGAPSNDGRLAATLENDPDIQLALREINRAAMQDMVLTRKDVLDGLMDAVRSAATSTELTTAWREIGRIIGAYEPQKIAVTHEHILPEQLRSMSDRQLIEIAGLGDLDAEYVVLDGESNGA